MAERISRTTHLCYRGHKPKISSAMDPAQVQAGESFASKQGIKAVDKKDLPSDTDGTPYLGHNGEDTVGLWTQEIYGLPVPNAKVTKLIRLDKFRGNYLEYANSRVLVRQCHFSSLLVTQGQAITPESMIGYEGATGDVSGKHLHTSIMIDGQYVDPRFYVTGQIPFPDDAPAKPISKPSGEKDASGRMQYADTDPYEYTLTKPVRMRVDTSFRKGVNVRTRPQTMYARKAYLAEGTLVEIDRRADFPDGQLWGRLRDKPWHWVCLYDPYAHADRGEWYLLKQ